MLPLFDMMLQAQNGHAIDVMARQFGLAQAEMVKATAALVPAFSMGLKQNAASPYDFGALMQAMATRSYAQYFEDMTKAFTPRGLDDGTAALERIFGSTDVARAVAAQAAQVTGITQDVMRQMMPVFANALMGGLFKQTSGQINSGASAFETSPFAAMMRPWMEATGLMRKPEPPPRMPFETPFTQAMQAYFAALTQGAQPQKPEAEPDLFAANPFFKAFQQMMTVGMPKAEPAPAPEPQPEAPVNPFRQMVNTLFESGLDMQKEYGKAVDQIFATYGGRRAE
ncbi:hypothetical protein BJF93_05325 [Xaviernesmea oryzae]|uniref:DUF937 domain-containing protein n=1 Tax=Xaviernesmea oryzae TaxID=464029 RepID=A0A1Q9ARP3_9HYPH|nr:DUF937 domain-containing protein [Xaviernesmea oryzae]OLP58058.1 hypothetical protein BJF93_05325 [Xaviernesmea oryzae]SEL84087.1 hypothetical protein SAMN04487976_113141 [Xaviernesmea oryzae]